MKNVTVTCDNCGDRILGEFARQAIPKVSFHMGSSYLLSYNFKSIEHLCFNCQVILQKILEEVVHSFDQRSKASMETMRLELKGKPDPK